MSSRRHGKHLLAATICAILAIILISPPLSARLKLIDDKTACAINMKTLGDIWAATCHNRDKPSIDKQKEDFYIDLVFRNLRQAGSALICPATGDKVDPAWNTATDPPPFKTGPNNCSYFGAADKSAFYDVFNAGPGDPIGGEHWFNHPDGVHVLFGDSHYKFYRWEDFSLSGPGEVFGEDWSAAPAGIDLTTIVGSTTAKPSPRPAQRPDLYVNEPDPPASGSSVAYVVGVVGVVVAALGFFAWLFYRKQH